VYQDEVHFQAQTTITASWYKKGSAPQVKSLPGNYKVPYSGFVRPDTGELFISTPSWFTFETTIESVREYIKANPIEDGKKFAMILDNAPWHKKAIRLIEDVNNAEYADIREKVVFVKLPPYSPDLNPIEQVWRITRRENTHNVFFKSKEDLKEKVDKAFSQWAKPNKQLQALCSFKRKC
jgi:transposase